MEYGKVLKRAWEITWRWKVLWILGFLVSLGNGSGGGGGGGGSSSYSGNGIQFDRWGGDWPAIWAAISGLVIGLLCLAFIIAIALWVISTIARGGLIAGVQQVEEEGNTGFGRAWRVGASRFWTLFGISVLTGIPILITVFVGLVALGGGIAAAVGLFEVSEAAGGISVAAIVLFGVALCCMMIPLSVVLGQIRIYAERAAVLEGMSWIDAFKRGWQVLKENLGPTIVLWLIFLLIGIAFGAVVVGGVVGLTAPFGILFGSSSTDPGPWILAPLCCGGLLAAIVLGLLGSIVETFTSATWTLAYRELTGWQGAQAQAAEEAPEEVIVEE
jgi:hypothetical protein